MSFILEFTQAGVTTFYATIVPPPPFLTGFGRIRKLALVRNGGMPLPSPPRGAATDSRHYSLQRVFVKVS